MRDKNDKSCYTIYSQRLAGYLMQNGFKLRHLVRSTDHNMHQFLFADTDALHQKIAEWKNKNS